MKESELKKELSSLLELVQTSIKDCPFGNVWILNPDCEWEESISDEIQQWLKENVARKIKSTSEIALTFQGSFFYVRGYKALNSSSRTWNYYVWVTKEKVDYKL